MSLDARIDEMEAAGCPLARELRLLRQYCACRADDEAVDEAIEEYLRLKFRQDAPQLPLGAWQPIGTAPCNDTDALVWFRDGGRNGWPCPHMEICDLDHDSDPQWWAERGATHWMPVPIEPTP